MGKASVTKLTKNQLEDFCNDCQYDVSYLNPVIAAAMKTLTHNEKTVIEKMIEKIFYEDMNFPQIVKESQIPQLTLIKIKNSALNKLKRNIILKVAIEDIKLYNENPEWWELYFRAKSDILKEVDNIIDTESNN